MFKQKTVTFDETSNSWREHVFWKDQAFYTKWRVCVCVCVCEREREREGGGKNKAETSRFGANLVKD